MPLVQQTYNEYEKEPVPLAGQLAEKRLAEREFELVTVVPSYHNITRLIVDDSVEWWFGYVIY